jgi:hypothetical protein
MVTVVWNLPKTPAGGELRGGVMLHEHVNSTMQNGNARHEKSTENPNFSGGGSSNWLKV